MPALKGNNTAYYDALGLAQDATPDNIKKAYRKAALKHHPDKHGNSIEATRKFQTVTRANEVLSTEWKKEIYDAFGDEALTMFEQYVQSTGIDPEDMGVTPLQSMAIACFCFSLLLLLFTIFAFMITENVDKLADKEQPLNWWTVFSPLLVMDALLIMGSCSALCSAGAEGFGLGSFLQVVSFVAFHVTLALKLNGSSQLSWPDTFAPWLLFELVRLPALLSGLAPAAWQAGRDSGFIADGYCTHVARILCSLAFRYTLLGLTVGKLSGALPWSWAKVAMPLWLWVAVELLAVLRTWCCVTLSDDERGKMLRQSLCIRLAVMVVVGVLILLLCLKLDGQGHYTAAIIGAPFFLFSGCYFCCCCLMCCGSIGDSGPGRAGDGADGTAAERTPLNAMGSSVGVPDSDNPLVDSV